MLKVTILDAHVVDQRETLSAYQGLTVFWVPSAQQECNMKDGW